MHEQKQRKPLLPLERARANRTPIDWSVDGPAAPPFTGTRELSPSIAELRTYIDWSFFFHAWELKGRFPAILDDPRQGAAARDLYGGSHQLLDTIESGGLLEARGVYGLWPAASEGDDIVLAGRHALPHAAPADRLRRLAGRIARSPTSSRRRRGLADDLGAFAVAVHGADELAHAYEADNDDYSSIMVKALADRLAEAFAEYLHLQVRRAWYAPDEQLDADDLAHERYRGIRPAFGYPACPDHSEKQRLFALLGADGAGLTLTESFAMLPAAAVSGIYFAHPQARYFSVSRIAQDQLRDYAERKAMTTRRGGAVAAPAALGRAVADFAARLHSGPPIVADGGLGALLAGAVPGLRCPEEANLRSPESVVAVHASYIRAGAELIETNTFRANRRNLATYLLEDEFERINSAAVRLAREAREVSGRDVFIAGAIGPLGELEMFDARDHGPLYAEQAQILEGRGVDLFMLETFFDLDELVAAVGAVRGVSSLPIVALLTFDEDAETSGGIGAAEAAARLAAARRRRDREQPRRRPARGADRARRDGRLAAAARDAPEHRPGQHRRRPRRLPALDPRVLRRVRRAGERAWARA